VFNCPSCGFEIDRDQNAGINLKNYGLNIIGLGESEFKAYGDWNAQGSIYEVGKSKSDLRRSTVFSG
jgi:transposase